uniref:Major facilitator superfamily (MFS) profile domain-containing protein n=1 Tax=Calcidiscus leptoporus TaxID=127549 RepID=A0A7S0JE39_9EUKA|mmetsp:Transcript_51532/g.118384  ORF Transcript_51532/g.118384 Transcript_51532/m.118384 type:complete len:240 (+) Transcript_51532:1-720(+)
MGVLDTSDTCRLSAANKQFEDANDLRLNHTHVKICPQRRRCLRCQLCQPAWIACTVVFIWFSLAFAYDMVEFFLIRYLHDAGHAGLIQRVTLIQYMSKLVGGILGACFVDRVGRRFLLIPSFAAGSAAVLLVSLVDAGTPAGRLGLIAAVSVFYASMEMVWSTLKTFTVELFATAVRGSAIGLATAAGFAGSSSTLALGPALMSIASAGVPFRLSAIALVLACLLTALLPETSQRALPS